MLSGPETIFNYERATIGERVIRSLLLPVVINKSAPNDILTDQNEWSTPEHAEPLKGFIRPVRPKIRYARRAEKPKNCKSSP